MKNRNKRDLISEAEFNASMIGSSTDPQEDSPGDSESDTDAEFEMGFNFNPAEENPILESKESEESDRILPDDLAVSVPPGQNIIPTSAMVKSSDQPSPRADRDSSSSTH
jgi:hypothetical protein